jgi:hypothetical protein
LLVTKASLRTLSLLPPELDWLVAAPVLAVVSPPEPESFLQPAMPAAIAKAVSSARAEMPLIALQIFTVWVSSFCSWDISVRLMSNPRTAVMSGLIRALPAPAEAAAPAVARGSYFAENLYTVVLVNVSPGFSVVVGKSGWFGESG